MINPSFLEEYIFFIFLVLISVSSGLLIRLLTSFLGISTSGKRIFSSDEVIGQILIREKPLQTFIRIYLWNMTISFIVIISGAVTFGVLPLVWAFLNLGFLFPDLNLFRFYLSPWIEESANILSAALGIWVGYNLHAFPQEYLSLLWIAISLSGLYVVSALMETFEIHESRIS